MKVIKQTWHFEQKPDNALQVLERAARVCYKSEHKIAQGTAETLLGALIKSGHDSVLEHCNVSVKIITDRAVAMEILRHRIGVGYSMQSQRYVSYKDGIAFIKPIWCEENVLGKWDHQKLPNYFEKIPDKDYALLYSLVESEVGYLELLECGCRPEEARVVLPNCTATEIFMTMNFRAWRHFFNLRCTNKVYPQTRALAVDMLDRFQAEWPVLFDDLFELHLGNMYRRKS
jgi:thymidylate synthase (FAD)